MKVKKKISIVSASIFALFSIASCTPPIPPDVLASFAEKDVQCANGEVKVGSSEVAAIAVQASIDSRIKAMGDDMLGSLNKTEFKNMASGDFSKMMVNFDPTKFSPDELKDFIPPSWNMNAQTGQLTAPPGAGLQFKALPSLDTASMQMPTLPDLNSKLALGGSATGGQYRSAGHDPGTGQC